jgi:ferredoxin--NADP+ reductase
MQPGDTPRMYSIASGTHDAEVWILYDLRPQGQLTPNLSQLRAGDPIFASPPSGNFYGSAQPSFWIASGTGIAPFVSMWRSGLNKDKTLIHGGRFLHSFYFEELFANASGIRYIRCCSQQSGEGVYHGRLTQWLQEQPDLPANLKYYLCGSAEMVVDARDVLIGKNISYDSILAEIYF